MMDRQFATFFISLVKELLVEEDDRERLFESLRRYKSDQDLDQLVVDLMSVLDDPTKLELYDYMRPLIMLRHQIEFSKQVPSAPGMKLRVVRLHRSGRESLGFSVRGGYEHGVGIFVTYVQDGSQAEKQGLMVGDEIVKVNGFTIAEAIHDDVLNLIKSQDNIILKVTQFGMIPVRDDPSDKVTWKYVTSRARDDQDFKDAPSDERPQDLRIYVDTTGHESMGCGIQSGPKSFPGIFIEKVRPNSIAEELGLERGDQLMEVNEVSFRHITFKEAVIALKRSRQLNMIIRKATGLKLINQLAASRNTNSTPAQPKENSVDRHKPSVSNQARPTSNRHHDMEDLDEASLIQHQLALNTRPLFAIDKHHQDDNPPPSSSSASLSPQLSISAEVHSTATDGSGFNSEWTTPSENYSVGHELRDEIERRRESNQSSPLSGAAAMIEARRLQSTSMATILGKGQGYEFNEHVSTKMYQQFESWELDGRSLKSLTYDKTQDLGIAVEGGSNSVLGGRVLVAMVFSDGLAKKCGRMKVGDQLMAMDGIKMVDISIMEAEQMLQNPSISSHKDTRELIFCESSLLNEEDSVTYF